MHFLKPVPYLPRASKDNQNQLALADPGCAEGSSLAAVGGSARAAATPSCGVAAGRRRDRRRNTSASGIAQHAIPHSTGSACQTCPNGVGPGTRASVWTAASSAPLWSEHPPVVQLPGLRFQFSISFGPPFHWFTKTPNLPSPVTRHPSCVMCHVSLLRNPQSPSGSSRPGADIFAFCSLLSRIMKITKRTQFQNGGSKFKSGLSVNSAAFAFAKRTQFSPDIPQGGDSLSPPALWGTGDPSAGTEQDRLFSNLPFASNRLPAGGFGRPAQNAALACRIPRISEFWLRASAFPLYSAIRTPNSTLKESNLIQPNPT